MTADVNALMEDLNDITGTARREFGGLTAEELNWKPNPREWSVAQCLDHLTLSAMAFLPTLRAIQEGTKPSTRWERLPVLPALWGALVRRAVDPERARKTRAPASLRPAESAIGPDIVNRFVASQRELHAFMSGTTPAMLRTIVTSPVARFVTYSLLDAYRIVLAHDRLHFRQARAVIASPGFPRATAPR